MPIVADGALPNEIYIGKDIDKPLYTYTNNELSIGSIKGTFNCNIISNELPIDTFTFGVYYDENQDRVYLTKDTRQAYVCAGYVPGTLADCGWVDGIVQPSNQGTTTVSDNKIVITGGLAGGASISPPDSHDNTVKFRAGDVVKIRIATEMDNKYCKTWVLTNRNHNYVSIESENNFFTITQTLYEYNAVAVANPYAPDPYPPLFLDGEDVLTITYTADCSQSLFIRGDGITTITISCIEFNGEIVYGSFVPNVDPNTPPLIYVLSRRGNVPAKKYLKDIKYGTPVFWFCDSNLQGKGYLKTVERTGTNTWKLTSMSAIGLLDEKIHPGGYYTGQTFDEVVQEIVGDSFPYEYAPGNESIAELAVFGWLPYDSARNNLHRLLFAMGAVLKRVDNQGG